MRENVNKSWLFLFGSVLAIVLMTGCGGSYSSDMTINGTRTVTRKSGEVSRTLKTNSKVFFKDGSLESFDPGATIQIEEAIKGNTVKGELREANGEMSLFIEHGGKFEPAAAEDQAWLKQFFVSMAIDDRDESIVAIEKIKSRAEEVPCGQAISEVIEEMSFAKNQQETLVEVIKTFELSVEDQKAIVDTAMEHVSFDKNQVEILKALVALEDFDESTAAHIRNSIEDLRKSSREEIEQAISKRGF